MHVARKQPDTQIMSLLVAMVLWEYCQMVDQLQPKILKCNNNIFSMCGHITDTSKCG